MLVFWIVLAAVIYFALFGCVLVFLAAVSRMNRHWERVFRESDGAYDEEWHGAA